jgi:hypothetical protein
MSTVSLRSGKFKVEIYPSDLRATAAMGGWVKGRGEC